MIHGRRIDRFKEVDTQPAIIILDAGVVNYLTAQSDPTQASLNMAPTCKNGKLLDKMLYGETTLAKQAKDTFQQGH